MCVPLAARGNSSPSPLWYFRDLYMSINLGARTARTRLSKIWPVVGVAG